MLLARLLARWPHLLFLEVLQILSCLCFMFVLARRLRMIRGTHERKPPLFFPPFSLRHPRDFQPAATPKENLAHTMLQNMSAVFVFVLSCMVKTLRSRNDKKSQQIRFFFTFFTFFFFFQSQVFCVAFCCFCWLCPYFEVFIYELTGGGMFSDVHAVLIVRTMFFLFSYDVFRLG